MTLPNDSAVLDISYHYAMLREQHESWRLLNAHRSPLILACAEQLFTGRHKPVTMAQAIELLADSFTKFRNDPNMQIGEKDPYKLARKEWREWLKRGLIVERDKEVFATNALERVLQFVKNLAEDSIMTSTASRFATVKDRLNHVATHLDENQQRREFALRQQIDDLKAQLAKVEQGIIEVMDEQQAQEAIKDIYQLSMSLLGDFRRVEDSYRQADLKLRERVIKDDVHRGDVVNSLLATREALLSTTEGQVFYGFNQQLQQRHELKKMQQQIKSILQHPSAKFALDNHQASDFRWLTLLLNKEAQQVNRAKERSEKDVRNFLQTGLASEQHRVGELLKQIFSTALDIDWQPQTQRKADSVLPPIAISLDNLTLIERLAIKEIKAQSSHQLELNTPQQNVTLDDLDSSFWQALDGLDRQAWFTKTLAVLKSSPTPLTLAQLTQQLSPPPKYDLEAIAMWLELAYQAEASFSSEYEMLVLTDEDNRHWQFRVPTVSLTERMLVSIAEDYVSPS